MSRILVFSRQLIESGLKQGYIIEVEGKYYMAGVEVYVQSELSDGDVKFGK